MYTPGYLPSLLAVFDGVKSYRNAIGINVHACHKIHLTNSLFADNFMAVDFERSEDLTLSNSIIIGESPSYRQLMARQDVRQVCLRGRMTGLQLGTWQNKYGPGYRISNVTFSGFKDALCERSAALNYDAMVSSNDASHHFYFCFIKRNQSLIFITFFFMYFILQTLKQGIFETISALDKIQLPEGLPLIDMCLIESSTFDMLYINDLKSSLRPASMNVASTVSSTLIASDNNELLKFVQPSKCVSVPEGCYSYCRDTCFRTVRVKMPAQSSWKLKLCAQGVTPAACVLYKLGRRGGGDYTAMVHAPVGQSYSASIVDSAGKTVVPTSQQVYYEENHCGTSRFQFSLANYADPISFVPWSDFS